MKCDTGGFINQDALSSLLLSLPTILCTDICVHVWKKIQVASQRSNPTAVDELMLTHQAQRSDAMLTNLIMICSSGAMRAPKCGD